MANTSIQNDQNYDEEKSFQENEISTSSVTNRHILDEPITKKPYHIYSSLRLFLLVLCLNIIMRLFFVQFLMKSIHHLPSIHFHYHHQNITPLVVSFWPQYNHEPLFLFVTSFLLHDDHQTLPLCVKSFRPRYYCNTVCRCLYFRVMEMLYCHLFFVSVGE